MNSYPENREASAFPGRDTRAPKRSVNWHMMRWRKRLPWPALGLLVFSLGPLIASSITLWSSLSLIGQPSIGVIPLWLQPYRCHAVSPITPASWPGMADGVLQTGDCIDRINGIPIEEAKDELERRALGFDGRNLLLITIRRDGEWLAVKTHAIRLTLQHVLQLQLGIVPIALFLWGMALLVLLAQPRAETNQVFAGLFLVVALAIPGLHHELRTWHGGAFVALTIIGGMALIGPLLYHLALLSPLPLTRFAWLRFALYPPGLAAWLFHVDSKLPLLPFLQPWRDDAAAWAMPLSGVLMLIGIATFLGRAGFLLWRGSRGLRDQLWILLASWGFGAGPLVLASAHYLLTFRVPIGTSLQPFLFCLVILCAGTAYVMLRYQSFAFRARTLNMLAAIYLSAMLAGAVMLALLAGIVQIPVDGLLFMTLWFATLMATLFWYLDNPFRRVFQRFFLRHQHHYRATLDFATRINSTPDLDAAVALGASMSRAALMTEWVAVRHILTPERVWLATTTEIQALQCPGADVMAALPGRPIWVEQLTSEGEVLGTLLIGPRNTPDSFDEEEERLITLLASLLANTMKIRAQLQRLAAVPELMLAAQEQERERISQEMHDAILPFMGALPLGFGQIQRLAQAGNIGEITRTCEIYSDKSVTTTRELRAIVRRLQPPLVGASRLGLSIRAFAVELCGLYDIQLDMRGVEMVTPFDEATARHLYRIIQQALVNAVQHGHPSHIQIHMTADPSFWECTVTDDGRGFDPLEPKENAHYGLVSMRERARTIGAMLMIESQPGQGTSVRLRVKG